MKRFKKFDIVTWETELTFPIGEVISLCYDACLVQVSVDIFVKDFHDIKIWIDNDKLVKVGSVL